MDNINLSNVSERLCLRYRNFFNVHKAEQQPPYQPTNHTIKLKPDTEPPYMCTYNMSPAELKALDIYLNNTLTKDWIWELKSSAGAPILFVPKKSNELHLYINYCGLNIIMIKNWYLLLLINELLNRLNSSTVFSKIDLWNTYHQIQIREGDK